MAAESLRGVVSASRYVKGERRQVRAPLLPMRKAPSPDAPLETEALFGETLVVFDEEEGWAWAQLDRDGYVGYVPAGDLSADVIAPTHRVTVLRTFLYSRPDIKAPPLAALSLNAQLAPKDEAGRFLVLVGDIFFYAAHACAIHDYAADFVSVAERFVGTPYLWGGRTSIGLDCSGLVQVALEASGIACPRDTDMQAAELGEQLDWIKTPLRRGDLVFWSGHVGIMTGSATLLHANAFHMATVIEPFAEARDRIAREGNKILCVRRLPRLSAAA